RGKIVNAGVVDEDIEATVGLLGFGEETIDVGLFGDIALDGEGFAAFAGDVGDDFIRARLAGGIVDDYRRTFGGEGLGDTSADAFGSAGDNGYLIFKLS